MKKLIGLAIFMALASDALGAETVTPCAGLDGAALDRCRADAQNRQQEKLEKLQERLQQQQERQQQLDDQQRQIQAQMEQIRQENEGLRQQLQSQKAVAQAPPPVAPPAMAPQGSDVRHPTVSSAELKQWKSENPWYGSDYARTSFASRYSKQLEQERPDLVGRPLLDAIAAKVNETFGPRR